MSGGEKKKMSLFVENNVISTRGIQPSLLEVVHDFAANNLLKATFFSRVGYER